MKEKKKPFIIIILSILIGWALVFFGWPFLIKNASFLLGFVVCSVLVALGFMAWLVWNKKAIEGKSLNKKSLPKSSTTINRNDVFIGILVAILVILIGVASSFLVVKQSELFEAQRQYQNKSLEQQSALIESIRRSNLVHLMGNVLDKVDDELKHNSNRTLSSATIARIAALSHSFKPYYYVEGDSLSNKKLSPERGQLLLALIVMDIDSSSFDRIKFKTSFAGADLSGANLWKANLSRANLREANLNGADLRRANLNEADLRGVDLWGANLNQASLRGTNLKRADLRWANLNEVDLKGANLNGAALAYAKLKKADLKGIFLTCADLQGALLNEANLLGINLKWTILKKAILKKAILKKANLRRTNFNGADLSGADLSETDLSGADLIGTDLSKANLSGADLFGVDFTKANLSEVILRNTIFNKTDLIEANLNEAKLTKAIIVEEKSWLEKLNKWQVIDAKVIQEKYKMVKDTLKQSNYRLEKREN